MRRCFAALTLVAALASAPAAAASPITIGSPLTGEFSSTETHIEGGLTLEQTALPGATLRSPVDGLVVAWRAVGLDVQGEYRLRVLRPGADGRTTGVGTGPLEKMTTASGVDEYPLSLPIHAGDAIGIDINYEGNIGLRETQGGRYSDWTPYLGDGQTLAPAPLEEPEEDVDPIEVGFDAIVRPAPTITALGPDHGTFKGGTKLTIEGTDFAGVSAVTIGGAPATFTAESETKISAIAPPVSGPAAAAISVTTPAGTAVATPTFAYEACRVPGLAGKKLKAARKKLKKAHCKLGKVKRKRHDSGKVTKQAPKPGKLLAPGSKVKVTLG